MSLRLIQSARQSAFGVLLWRWQEWLTVDRRWCCRRGLLGRDPGPQYKADFAPPVTMAFLKPCQRRGIDLNANIASAGRRPVRQCIGRRALFARSIRAKIGLEQCLIVE